MCLVFSSEAYIDLERHDLKATSYLERQFMKKNLKVEIDFNGMKKKYASKSFSTVSFLQRSEIRNRPLNEVTE